MSTEPEPTTQAPRLDAPPQPDSTPSPQPGPQQPPHHPIKRTRITGLWIAGIIFAVVLLFLLIFILQNNRDVNISYLGAQGHMPLGVALLLAAVCGALLAILAAVTRIAQLHSVARRHRRTDAKR
jgi:lipopolysaccharide assembly protein A